MPLHTIRFRKAWHGLTVWRNQPLESLPPRDRFDRIDLPLTLDPGWARILLWRVFREPAAERAGEKLVLRFRRVAGLVSLRLDEAEQDIAGQDPLEAPIIRRPGGVHQIELDARLEGLQLEERSDWGDITLEIDPCETDGHDAAEAG
jgi:hypothetical protein